MDPLRIAIRALIAFVYLLTLVRISGKRTVSESSPFDLAVAIVIGDLIDDLLWAEVPVAQFIVGGGTIFLLDIAVVMGAFHSRSVYKLVTGMPVIAMRDGRIDHDRLRSEQLNDEDLAHLLRKQQVDRHDDVKLAVLEHDHDLGVILTDAAQPATKEDKKALKRAME